MFFSLEQIKTTIRKKIYSVQISLERHLLTNTYVRTNWQRNPSFIIRQQLCFRPSFYSCKENFFFFTVLSSHKSYHYN